MKKLYFFVFLFIYSIGFAQTNAEYPNWNVTVNDNPSDGQLFFTPFSINPAHPFAPFLIAMNNDGSVAFGRKMSNTVFDFKLQPNGYYTYYDGPTGNFYVMDAYFNNVDSFKIANNYLPDLHEIRLLNDGSALLLGYEYKYVDMTSYGGKAKALVTGQIIQKQNSSHQVTFEWTSWDHFKITDATKDIKLTDSLIDYVHSNAIEIDNDGNYLLSSRNMDEITKIDSKSGDIIWRLGGKNNQFTFINDTIGFSHQHCVRKIANGNIIIFDNGNLHKVPRSRAVEYKLDEINKTATLVWQYVNQPAIYSWAMGSVQRLDNGNTVIGWGSNITNNIAITEVTSAGKKVFELDLPYNCSYRAFKYNLIYTSVEDTKTYLNNYSLAQNYPNPFNPSTKIKYTVPQGKGEQSVSLKVFDMMGKEVATLVNEVKYPGEYEISFNSSKYNLASGVYIYKLTVDSYSALRKMLLLK